MPDAPPLPGPSHLSLAVADLDRALCFYAALGLRPSGGAPAGIAMLPLGPLVLCLLPAERLSAELGAPVAPGPGGVALSINLPAAADVDRLAAAAAAGGGRVTVPPGAPAWGGWRAWVEDPDGHRWELVWNPRWQAAPDDRPATHRDGN